MQESSALDHDRPRGTPPTPSAGSGNLVFDVANWHPKPVKRPRPVKSCSECRRRKLRCDRRCPCSQCQRSYRVCKYGSGGTNSGAGDHDGSGSRANDPHNSALDSEGSEGSEDDGDSAAGGSNGERPHKRLSSRPAPGLTSQPMPATHLPSFNSSLSLLLNPPSPASQHAVSPAAFPGAGISAAADISTAAPASGHTRKVAPSAKNESPLLTLSGHELRQFTSGLIDEFSARMERLEKLVLAKDASALLSIPPFPSSATLSQLHLLQSQVPGRHIIDASSNTMRSLTVKGPQGLRTKYFGQSSSRVLLNLFDEAKDFMCDKAKRDTAGDSLASLERIYNTLQDEHRQALKPITVYVDSMMPVQKRMADILPRRDVCDRLFESYINVSEGLYRIIHIPTFRREYEAFWDSGDASSLGGLPAHNGGGSLGNNSTNGSVHEVVEDFLPRLLCVMCIGSRFETESKGLCYDRSDGVHIPTACSLVRSWLDSMRRKQYMDINTLRAELLLLHASRMIEPRSEKLWMDLGLISRIGMAMGLHRDPSEFTSQLTPFQAELRRRLWFSILDMDLHVALACSLPNALGPSEFTCQPPRNLADTDLFPEMTALPPGRPMEQYTDGQTQAYAASTLPLRLRANHLLSNIDALQDYREVLAVGAELQKALDDINCLFPRNPVLGSQQKHREWRMRAILDMHIRRPLLALYRPFALSAPADYPAPAAITDVYVKSCMAMLTYMEELDPNMPGYERVSHMYYVVLRLDIMQAAFSVCYYIKQAIEAEATADMNLSPGGASDDKNSAIRGGLSASPDNASTAASPDGRNSPGKSGQGSKKPQALIWSSAYMIRTIERTVENLARLAGDLSTDLRDVITLAVVLGSVQPALSQAERNEHICKQITRVRDGCFAKLRGHASPSVRAVVSAPNLPSSFIPEWYNRPTNLLLNQKNQVPDESPFWDAGFWDPWPISTQQGNI